MKILNLKKIRQLFCDSKRINISLRVFSTVFPLRSLNLNLITYLIVSKLSINQNIPIIVPFPPLGALSYKKRGCYVPMFWAQRNCALMRLNDFPLTWPFFPFFLSSFYFLSILCVFFFSFAQLFRQYLHQSFLLSRAGDFGSASLAAGRDCSASGLDDALLPG